MQSRTTASQCLSSRQNRINRKSGHGDSVHFHKRFIALRTGLEGRYNYIQKARSDNGDLCGWTRPRQKETKKALQSVVDMVGLRVVARNDNFAALGRLVERTIRFVNAAAQAIELDIRLNYFDKVLVADAEGTSGIVGVHLSTMVPGRKLELGTIDAARHLGVPAGGISVIVTRGNEASRKNLGIGDLDGSLRAPRNGVELVRGDRFTNLGRHEQAEKAVLADVRPLVRGRIRRGSSRRGISRRGISRRGSSRRGSGRRDRGEGQNQGQEESNCVEEHVEGE